MKNKFKLLSILLIANGVYAQQPPTNTDPAGNASGRNSQQYWSKGGNTDNLGTNNIFGTLFNSPIYTQTAGVNRMTINGNLTVPNPAFGFFPGNINTSGFVGINTTSPYAPLHIKGNDLQLGLGGYRSWMRTGMLISNSTDNMYFGLRPSNTQGAQDAVINWGDNVDDAAGPDNLIFNYTSYSSAGQIQSSTQKGLEIVRMIYNGNVGIGPVFDNPVNQRPQSLLHMNREGNLTTYLQFSNQLGTGQQATDGLRVGIFGDPNNNINGTALMYNQEERPILFSTNANTTTINMNNGTTHERIRIMSVGTPTNLAGGMFGPYNPAGINQNLTRMAISHDPANPVTRPLSLLHLGYNTSSAPIIGFPLQDGWRPWMDVGMFISQNSDNMYMGMKDEGNDRKDAVISWGDNIDDAVGLDNLISIILLSTQQG